MQRVNKPEALDNAITVDKDYEKYYNKGNDCDACTNQYLCGRDGDCLGCRCADEGKECHFVEAEQ